MRNNSPAESLLSLFTTHEVAVSIVGDLIEQRCSRRRGWFACEVARLALALCVRGVVAAPGRALRLAALGFCVYGGAEIVLFVAVGLPWYPWNRVHEPGFWIRLGLVVVLSNFATGAILTRPRHSGSMTPVAPLVAVWVALWLVWPFALSIAYPWAALWRDLVPWPALVPGPLAVISALALFPLLYLLPLLLGAVIVQRRRDYALSRTA